MKKHTNHNLVRPLFVQRQIETPLARMMIKENMPEGTKVNVDLNDSQELTFDVQNLQLNRRHWKAKLSNAFIIKRYITPNT